MAGRSRRSSTELEPDLSTPTAPKRLKQSETSSESSEEHLPEVESTETPSTSEISLQTEVVREEVKQLSDVAEQAGTSKQSVLITETSSESTKQSQTDPDLPRRESDIASTSTEAIPSTSREEQLKTLKSVVMKYSDQGGELSDPSGRPEETTVQSFLLRERASFENLSVIGNGAYGTVYKATDKNSGQTVALKRVRIPLTEDGLPTSTVREIAALKSLEQYEHPHIVSTF